MTTPTTELPPPPVMRSKTADVTIIESPYRGCPDGARYLAWCIHDCVMRGEYPIASHLALPLALPEDEPVTTMDDDTLKALDLDWRTSVDGRDIGLALQKAFEASLWKCAYEGLITMQYAFYTDLKASAGMLAKALALRGAPGSVRVQSRLLEEGALASFAAGGWPSSARLFPNHPVPVRGVPG